MWRAQANGERALIRSVSVVRGRDKKSSRARRVCDAWERPAAASALRRRYVRSTVIGQARRELAAAEAHVIALPAAEQLEFWEALAKPAKLTKAQKRLGAMMRGEA